MPLDCSLLQVQREAWTTDLDLPIFAVTAEQAAEVPCFAWIFVQTAFKYYK